MRLDDNALRTVFRCFDLDNSGGIDLGELQSAIHVLGISVSKSKVAEMFFEADADGSGEIDFEEFRSVIEKGDGGQLASIIHKMHDDEACRDVVRERTRPKTMLPGPLQEQLDRVREERQWFSGLHMNSAHAAAKAKQSGYIDDQSVYIRLEAPVARASVGPRASPDRVSAQLPLSPNRAARRMLPSLEVETLRDTSPVRGPGLRRIFGANASAMSPGRTVMDSPNHRRRMLGMLAQSPADPYYPSPGGGRSTSMPMRRPAFYGAAVAPSCGSP
mmetsp:Transcript_33695/g.88593  ORF Transcript_33695/g.88593 Transcript_33695/m.88593 type:complete len:274 (-) Transcript_33695:645-1466(-)